MPEAACITAFESRGPGSCLARRLGLTVPQFGGARPRRGRAMARSRHHHPCAGAALARRQSDERAEGGLRRLRAVAPAGLSVAVASGVSEVRIGLAAGGSEIRTLGTASESCLDFGKSVHLAEIFASQDATSGCGRSRLRSLRFARASSVGWQRTTRWMALLRELCVSRQVIQRSDLS